MKGGTAGDRGVERVFGLGARSEALFTEDDSWDGIALLTVLWGFVGLCGVVYAIVVAHRMRVQRAYQPVIEDWLFHLLLPFAAYAVLAVAAYAAHSHTRPALFLVGAAALLLLFIGIHNAWDTVTYQVFVRSRQEE